MPSDPKGGHTGRERPYRCMVPNRLRRLETVSLPGLCEHAHVAATPLARLRGLAGLARLPAGHGLLIPRCRSVHTFGMRFALDIVFLDADGLPVERRTNVAPGRLVGCRAASAVLELPAKPARRPAPRA